MNLLLRILAVIGRYGCHFMIVTQNNFKNCPGISDRLFGFYQIFFFKLTAFLQSQLLFSSQQSRGVRSIECNFCLWRLELLVFTFGRAIFVVFMGSIVKCRKAQGRLVCPHLLLVWTPYLLILMASHKCSSVSQSVWSFWFKYDSSL